jgi:hypothetical protein
MTAYDADTKICTVEDADGEVYECEFADLDFGS